MNASPGATAAQAAARFLQVGFERRAVGVGDWAGAARHRLAAEPCGAAARLVETLHEVGVVEQIAVGRGLRRPLGLAAAECRDAGQAVKDIEGVGDLAEFAVADAIDAGCDLLLDDLADSLGETSVKAICSNGRPVSRASRNSSRSDGRGRLPTWVVRIRSVLVFMLAAPMRTIATR